MFISQKIGTVYIKKVLLASYIYYISMTSLNVPDLFVTDTFPHHHRLSWWYICLLEYMRIYLVKVECNRAVFSPDPPMFISSCKDTKKGHSRNHDQSPLYMEGWLWVSYYLWSRCTWEEKPSLSIKLVVTFFSPVVT